MIIRGKNLQQGEGNDPAKAANIIQLGALSKNLKGSEKNAETGEMVQRTIGPALPVYPLTHVSHHQQLSRTVIEAKPREKVRQVQPAYLQKGQSTVNTNTGNITGPGTSTAEGEPGPAPNPIDIEAVADEVYRILERRLELEKERTGG